MAEERRVSWVDEICRALPAGALQERESFRGQETIIIAQEMLLDVMRMLRDNWGFRYLSDLTALDFYPSVPRFQVVYHLWRHDRADFGTIQADGGPGNSGESSSSGHQGGRLLRVKVKVANDPPSIPSVTSIWSAADWHERECYDLFGILFDGHPDLRRILLPDDWVGHPLRKDYPVEGY